MPVQSFGHSAFWSKDSAGAPPEVAGAAGGYPACQAGTCAASLFGALQPWWDRLVRAGWWWARVLLQLWRLGPDERHNIDRIVHQMTLVDGWLSLPPAHQGLVVRVAQFDDEQLAILHRVVDLIHSEAWLAAEQAVRETAVTLGFNRPEAWKPYSHMLKKDHRRAENLFRHVRACESVKACAAAPVSNPDLNLLTELAYQGFCWRNR